MCRLLIALAIAMVITLPAIGQPVTEIWSPVSGECTMSSPSFASTPPLSLSSATLPDPNYGKTGLVLLNVNWGSIVDTSGNNSIIWDPTITGQIVDNTGTVTGTPGGLRAMTSAEETRAAAIYTAQSTTLLSAPSNLVILRRIIAQNGWSGLTNAQQTEVIEAALSVGFGTRDALDYAVSLSASSISIAPGSSGSSTLSVIPINGFPDIVSVSASAPSGFTVSLSASSVTPGSSTAADTITVTVGSSVAAGTYAVTIGTASTPMTGSDAESATLTVTVP